MIFDLIEDIVKLTIIVATLFWTLRTFVHSKQPELAETVERKRFVVLFGLVLIVLAIKITEDVLGGESGPVDRTILLFIHSHFPESLKPFFKVITFTGSSKFLFPLTVIATCLLLIKHRFEAFLLAVSQTSAALFIVIIKTLVARDRPSLWDVDWYWGSSFPSGHTLGVATFATAATLCVLRIQPGAWGFTIALATVWVFLVGLSRLVLGVHWPSDVLVAACIGTFLPLLISAYMHIHKS